MGQWKITGVDKDSGRDRTMTVEAADESSAVGTANAHNIMVSAAAKIPRSSKKAGQRKAKSPEYAFLQAASLIVFIVGVIQSLVGALGAILHIANPPAIEQREVWGGIVETGGVSITTVGACLGVFIIGVFIAATGQAGLALRDIARNSWDG